MHIESYNRIKIVDRWEIYMNDNAYDAIAVSKYHGCGNDFLISKDQSFTKTQKQSLVKKLCDRHIGIGADGFLFVLEKPLRMEYFNCDGSTAPMCGNGMRCFARYVYEKRIVHSTTFDVLCGAKKYHIDIESIDPFLIKVDMGKVSFSHALLHIEEDIWQKEIIVQNQCFLIDTLFLGTIHTVMMIKDKQTDFETLGREIHQLPLFHEKTNVNFVMIEDRSHIRVRTYERGVGMTLACGSGSCAAAYVAFRHGCIDPFVRVHMPKGELCIRIQEDGHIIMHGSAKKIMEGIAFWDDEQTGMWKQPVSYNDKE